MTLSAPLATQGNRIASDIRGFHPISPCGRITMSREEAARKWKCSPGTIDKYSN